MVGPLARWLHSHGQTQAELRLKLGLSSASMSKIVSGQRMARPDVALQIEAITGITVAEQARWRAAYVKPRDPKAARVRYAHDLIARGHAILKRCGAEV